MRPMIAALTVALLLALPSAASAYEGKVAASWLTAPPSSAFGFTKSCGNVRGWDGLRFRSIQVRNMSCKTARKYATGFDRRGDFVDLPKAYDCGYTTTPAKSFRYWCWRADVKPADGLPLRALSYVVV